MSDKDVSKELNYVVDCKTKSDFEMYLAAVKKIRSELPLQEQLGWIKLIEIVSLEDHDKAVIQFEKAIDSNDLDLMLIEKVFLDQILTRMTREIISSKTKVAINHLDETDKELC